MEHFGQNQSHCRQRQGQRGSSWHGYHYGYHQQRQKKTATCAVTVTAAHAVTLDMDGGSAVASQTIASGGKATKPAPYPTKTGFTFRGWHKDSDKTNVFNFETETITADTTIYAKWTAIPTNFAPTGLQNNTIPNSSITANSNYPGNDPWKCRLNNTIDQYWASGQPPTTNEWRKVDLGTTKWVGKIATRRQGQRGKSTDNKL